MNLTYAEIKSLFPQHSLKHEDQERVSGISRDTRTIKPGEIYVAIVGEKFDGHKYVDLAFEKGASAVLVSNTNYCQENAIVVDDTIVAMGRLAQYYRAKFTQPVVAITGSNGKTTTKELLTHVLSLSGKVVATQGNLNNHIGVPLTVCSFEPEAKYFVVEMGMNHLGEIQYLTDMVKPTVGLITNIGHAHLEGLGSIENVAKAKGELFKGLEKAATAFVFRDCSYISKLKTKAQTISFGFDDKAMIYASDIKTEEGKTSFVIHYGNKKVLLKISLIGKHHVQNALAVFAVAQHLGLETDVIKNGLESFEIKLNRGRKMIVGNVHLIDDTYNANPDSMTVALETLCLEFSKSYKVAVLGAMGELGTTSHQLHQDIGKKASQMGIDEMFGYGELAINYLAGFGYDSKESQKRLFDDQQIMANAILRVLSEKADSVVVLFKGSRLMTMEKVLASVKEGL